MKFSACWIAKNEADVLTRSIDSVKGIVDELVVVDTGSTDNTVELAKAAGARVEFFEWIGDFSAARNFALAQTTGDVVIFTDADEWFDPTLNEDDRARIEGLFTSDPSLDALQVPIWNLNQQGGVKNITSSNRIVRKSPNLKFHKPVHEEFLKANGDTPKFLVLNDWHLRHTGYTENLLFTKMQRNIALLEEACVSSDNPMDRHMHHMYLVREYYQLSDMNNSIRHLNVALSEPGLLRKQCQHYQHGLTQILYHMMIAASIGRGLVSRREIHRKIVEPFKEYIKDYPGLPTLELYYDALFNLKEDIILAQAGQALATAKKMTPSPVDYHKETEIQICHCAAMASQRRGKALQAMEFATSSFAYRQTGTPETLNVLLSSIRGQPAEEIVVFLNSQFDLNDPQKLDFLTAGTFIHGFRDVHAYYLTRRINAALATKGDYLYLLQLYGKYSESVAAALDMDDEKNREAVNRNLFIAAICSGDESIYRDHSERLLSYARILEAFFTGGELPDATSQEMQILSDNYTLIAFASGLETGDKLLGIFNTQPVLRFRVKGHYCVGSCLYREVLTGEPAPEEDFVSNRLWVQCLVMADRLDEAYDKIKAYFDAGVVNDVLLQNLLALSDRAPGDLKVKARELYDVYIRLHDERIDLADVINTKYASDDSDKKRSRNYRAQTPAQFRKQLANDEQLTQIDGLLDLKQKAGAVYEELGLNASAADCYRYAVAKKFDTAENYKNLARVYRAMGNYQLGAELDKMANAE